MINFPIPAGSRVAIQRRIDSALKAIYQYFTFSKPWPLINGLNTDLSRVTKE